MFSSNSQKTPADLHTPVLADEVMADMAPMKGGKYLDGTLGLGGHAQRLLEAAPDCEICALDRDSEALGLARERLAAYDDAVHYYHLPFSRFEEALKDLAWPGVNGCLLDLGVSSLQLDEAGRGFSYRLNGPLDMRMDRTEGNLSAKDIVNNFAFEELRELIVRYGEEPQAARVARAILKAREKGLIEDTATLAEVIAGAYPAAWRRKARNHPARRAFQALRLRVNDELEELESFLQNIFPWLLPQGRLVIISFHSLEDRLVKNFFRDWSRGIFLCQAQAKNESGAHYIAKILHKKPLTACHEELKNNPRSKSAKLRTVEKVPAE